MRADRRNSSKSLAALRNLNKNLVGRHSRGFLRSPAPVRDKGADVHLTPPYLGATSAFQGERLGGIPHEGETFRDARFRRNMATRREPWRRLFYRKGRTDKSIERRDKTMSFQTDAGSRLSRAKLLELKRLNTPTVYNGWEQITKHNAAREAFNMEETRDFMPQMGPMVGYAVTVIAEPSNPDHPKNNPNASSEYLSYVASVPGPKIVVVQDLDKPKVFGAFWGEVSSNIHRGLGCVGTIIDGAIRDVDEMANAGFKAIARRMSVGHAYCCPMRWNCEVEVFGRKVRPGQLIHADKHGFLAIPEEDEVRLLEAAQFMDSNECNSVIAAARSTVGKSVAQILSEMDAAVKAFRTAVQKKFGTKGEW
jgi:4-hydroxy-4-methyl-2-oxoglutarate aldolase